MSLTIGEVVRAETGRGTLLKERAEVHETEMGDVVYHHEWARTSDLANHLVCVMWAGLGKLYLHDLDAKSLHVTREKFSDLGLTFMDTD